MTWHLILANTSQLLSDICSRQTYPCLGEGSGEPWPQSRLKRSKRTATRLHGTAASFEERGRVPKLASTPWQWFLLHEGAQSNFHRWCRKLRTRKASCTLLLVHSWHGMYPYAKIALGTAGLESYVGVHRLGTQDGKHKEREWPTSGFGMRGTGEIVQLESARGGSHSPHRRVW